MLKKLSDLLEVVGMVAVTAGVALVSVPAALIVAGVLCITVALVAGS